MSVDATTETQELKQVLETKVSQELQAEERILNFYGELAYVLNDLLLPKTIAEKIMVYAIKSERVEVCEKVEKKFFPPLLTWAYDPVRKRGESIEIDCGIESTQKKSEPISPLLVESLINHLSHVKLNTTRESPEAIIRNIRFILSQPKYFYHVEIFEALMRFAYLFQVKHIQNRTTLKLLSEVEVLIHSFEEAGALEDLALIELLKIISVYKTNDAKTLENIIDLASYPFKAYQFLAKYLYVNILKNPDPKKKSLYEAEMNQEAFQSWLGRKPENILSNKPFETILDALNKADSQFDFMHYFYVLYSSRSQVSEEIRLTDLKLEAYINVLSEKFNQFPYYICNIKTWFLSIVPPGYSYESLSKFFLDVWKIGTNQQKALAFEYYNKQLSNRSHSIKNVALEYLPYLEDLTIVLRSEEDYYGLRSIATGLLHANLGEDTRMKALTLLDFIKENTKDPLLLQFIGQDFKIADEKVAMAKPKA